MKIKNDVLYRDHYDPQPISVYLYPNLDSYNDTTSELSLEQEGKHSDELDILHKFIGLKSVRDLFQINDNIISISQYPQFVEEVKTDLKKNNLPESLLKNVFSINEDGYPNIYMLPNIDFPICSILSLKNAKNSSIYNGSSVTQQRWNLLENYEQKAAELKDCTDKKFVQKSLEPFQKKIDEFDEKNKEMIKEVKSKEEMFNNHLEKLGLKKEFDIFESPSKDIQEDVKPVKPAKKRKA